MALVRDIQERQGGLGFHLRISDPRSRHHNFDACILPAKKYAGGNAFLKACSLSLSTEALCYTPWRAQR